MTDFPEAEFAHRTERAQKAMAREGLDALLFTTEPEVRYFSGFRTLFWESPTRPWFLVVPATGKPIAVIPEIGAALMRGTWLDDVRTWSSPHAEDDGVSLLAGALEGCAKVGMPMGRTSRLRMPLADFDRLRGKASAEFVDATPLVLAIRRVKSEAEIALIRQICAIGSTAFGRAEELFRAGQPLRQAFRAFKIALLEAGAEEVPYLVGGAGPEGYVDVISPPDDTPLREGDVFMLDTGATLKGYFCDFDRNFAIGDAGEAARKANRTLWDATEAAIGKARPGATCADLFRAMAEITGTGESDIGRSGHGLGIEMTEEPSLIGFDRTVLEPGMVLTIEPSMAVGEGTVMVHEENIVIRDGAPELLTRRAPPELPVI